jgi:type IV conjugative transfer system protein TraL
MSTQGIDKARSIPTRVDEPVPFFLWEPVEFVVAITSFGFFMVINMAIVGLITMVGILWISRELKKGAKRGATQHAIWAIGFTMDPVLPSRFPPSYINELVE